MDSDQGKLFIGGISWETTEEKLKEHFSTYGEIVEAVIMKDRATGRARGFGFVVFADPAVADRALLDKHTIDGRVVESKKAVPRDEQQNSSRTSMGGPRTKKIFVGGLAATVTEDDFKKYFGQFGNITDAVVMYDHSTQRPRGFGFITFDTEDAVDRVLEKTFHELNEKMVEVKAAVPRELSAPGGRNSGGGYGGGSGRGGSFNGGYGQGYNTSPGNTYGNRMDNRYAAPPAGRAGYPSYGYGAAPYGYGAGYGAAMNGGYGGSSYPGGPGYGATGSYGGGYGSTPAPAGYAAPGGYGAPAASGGYGAASAGPRSPWGGAGGGYSSGGSPAGFGANGGGMSGYGSAGWGSGATTGQATAAAGYGSGGYGYGVGKAGYGSSASAYGARDGKYGSGPTGAGAGYGDPYGSSGYQENGWRSGADSHSSPAAGSGPGGAGHGVGGPAAEGYGVAGRQTQRGPDARFRPYPATAERAS